LTFLVVQLVHDVMAESGWTSAADATSRADELKLQAKLVSLH
jgi:hypothetical protein